MSEQQNNHGASSLTIKTPTFSHLPTTPGCVCCTALAQENHRLREELERIQAQITALSPRNQRGRGRTSSSSSSGSRHKHSTSVLKDGREVRIAPDELAAMRAIFSLFDKDGDGKISTEDLKSLHLKLGEPLTDEEAADALSVLRTSSSSGIHHDESFHLNAAENSPTSSLSPEENACSFEDFCLYWDGLHPSLRKVGEPAHEDETLDSAAIVAEKERKKRWYAGRFKFVKARIPSPAIARVFQETTGVFPSLEYRIHFFYDGGAQFGKVEISPWHDVPFRNNDGTFNMIVEIPKWSKSKFEISTGEPFNPMKQDVKNGRLREYGQDMCWNYGLIPQTYESPSHISPDTNCGGDNDPLDAIEVGTKMWSTGSIVRVKVLGVIGLIDDGETDWKIITISAEDPLAPFIETLEDLNSQIPGVIPALIRWFKYYKAPLINDFAFDGEARGRDYALGIISECHTMWEQLVDERTHPHTIGNNSSSSSGGGGLQSRLSLTGGAGSGGNSSSGTGSSDSSSNSSSDGAGGGSGNGDEKKTSGSSNNNGSGSSSGNVHVEPSIVAAGLRRSTSNNKLAHIFMQN